MGSPAESKTGLYKDENSPDESEMTPMEREETGRAKSTRGIVFSSQ